MNSCAILGASGHGKVIAEIAELNGYKKVDFFDDTWPELKTVHHWLVLGNSERLLALVSQYDIVVIAIGDNTIRLKKQIEFQAKGANFSVLKHPSAIVSRYSELDVGTVVMANAVINSFASIGVASIVNTSATVDHDCKLGNGVHISPGVNLAGGVTVGELSWIGLGAQVKQLINIGDQVIVGAGSTVVNDISNNQIVIGTPAKPLDKFKEQTIKVSLC
ncbi:acetyltransferase [Parashewanella spongiae]|uniref:Acetyltransferase n=1 Tax=Parashewanella spongiae TaxID=342950 RepID=A0A3A6U2I1_9GAMM|nr:acetyltransferase [Parashewanella spongiae]MCL1077689.1 acetyltransferase [Parashewanella spongiae]RJY18226.1 acetyltransferase [Parashewanella spongiae]